MPRKKTGTPEDYTVEQMRVAILRSRGLVTHAAKHLKCAPSTVYDYIKRHPEVKAALEEARSEMTDLAEEKLYNHIKASQPWAIQFYLKTQGKERGYVERQEVAGVDSMPLEININRVSRRESLDEPPRIDPDADQ